MTNFDPKFIWNPSTGIVDLEADVETLSASEIPGIKAIWTDQRARLKGTKQLTSFTDRLSREWAIETGAIENLYDIDRGVTQTLIEYGFQSELLIHGSVNRPREYVLNLLRDQKDALDGVFDFVKNERSLSVSYIKELHAALLRSQDVADGIDSQGRAVEIPLVRGDWKLQPNSPSRENTTFFYCPPEQVASEMDRLLSLHNRHIEKGIPSEIQAGWLHHRFSQIHPFQDGNGRVARAIASLVLVKDGLFPLVVTRDDQPTYVNALEIADEGNLKPLIDLFAKFQIVQFRKASAISESLLVEQDIATLISGLAKAADKVAATKLSELKGVFSLARILEEDLESRLKLIAIDVTSALKRVASSGTSFVTSTSENTSFYFRSQIIENARKYLGYFVDTAEYRSWICLNMNWTRRARLVFAFHGIGKPFNGSLICAPFMEFRDTDEEGQVRSSMIPVTEEGFVFFYNEAAERLLGRFRPWRESVLKVCLKEMIQGLSL